MKTFHLVSLGCPKNRVDSEVAIACLMDAGLNPVDDPAKADVILVNTCSFITAAKSESIDTLLEMARYRTDGRLQKLVAMGCLGQEAAVELAENMPELDLILGTGDVDRIPALLRAGPRVARGPAQTYLPASPTRRVLSQSPAFAYLKVADGCSRTCAFCTIPSIKGPFASRPIAPLVDDAQALVDAGVKELVLVAQDLTQYGKPGRRRLMTLLDRLERIDGLAWIRLMYLYPEGITRPLLERVAAGGKVIPYLDMPVQHADDRVLRAMRRSTRAARIRRILDEIRTLAPDIALRTTIIVGHPGETDQAYATLRDFVSEIRFENLGVFTYSPEPGTLSAMLPDPVPEETAAARQEELMTLQQGISATRNNALVGTRQEVLVVGPAPDHDWVLSGRTTAQAPEVDGIVYLDDCEAEPGTFVTVEITGASDYDLVGVPVNEED